jgi:hypothetical protein
MIHSLDSGGMPSTTRTTGAVHLSGTVDMPPATLDRFRPAPPPVATPARTGPGGDTENRLVVVGVAQGSRPRPAHSAARVDVVPRSSATKAPTVVAALTRGTDGGRRDRCAGAGRDQPRRGYAGSH